MERVLKRGLPPLRKTLDHLPLREVNQAGDKETLKNKNERAGSVAGLPALQTKKIIPSLEGEMERVLKRGLPPLRETLFPLPCEGEMERVLKRGWPPLRKTSFPLPSREGAGDR